MKKIFYSLYLIVKGWLLKFGKTSLNLFKIMIPINIIVKILQETGAIDYVGVFLEPLMKLVGLPGEMGLVWASAIFTNIYGGLITFFAIASDVQLTVAQISILSTIMLIAHALPIELTVTRKTGVKFFPIFIVRFGGAILAGIILNLIYSQLDVLTQYPVMVKFLEVSTDTSLIAWGLSVLKNYFFIFLWILALVALMDILDRVGLIRLINIVLEPLLGWVGISKDALPLTVVGLTLGLTYGGALIVQGVKDDNLPQRDVFYSIFLLSLCHSIIDDSILVMSIGAHYSAIFIFRIIFTLALSYLLVLITKKWSESKMKKYFYVR